MLHDTNSHAVLTVDDSEDIHQTTIQFDDPTLDRKLVHRPAAVLTLVDLPAVEPDLALRPRERADGAHPHHRLGEVGGEHGGVAAVLLHQRVLRAAVEELLVRVEQPLPGHQVLVVGVVERLGGPDVDGRQRGVAGAAVAGLRARLLPERREGGVDVGVAVDAAAEGGAPGLPDGVRARQRRHVARRQALVAEHGDEGGEARPWPREVAVRVALARRPRVPPAEVHRPRRPAELHALFRKVDVSGLASVAACNKALHRVMDALAAWRRR